MKGKEEAVGSAFVVSSLDLLFLVFLVLKLTNVIDWSWWWVTSPIWIPLAAIAALLTGAGVLLGISKLVK